MSVETLTNQENLSSSSASGKWRITMKNTLNKISKIAFAIGFGLAVCATPMRSAFADDEHHGRGHEWHHRDSGDRDRDYDRDRGYAYAPGPSYYYAPGPDYYTAPEPNYYDYPPSEGYYPQPPPPSGINLFFGL